MFPSVGHVVPCAPKEWPMSERCPARYAHIKQQRRLVDVTLGRWWRVWRWLSVGRNISEGGRRG